MQTTRTILLAGAGLLLWGAAPAQAGFQWVTPPEQPEIMAPPPEMMMPGTALPAPMLRPPLADPLIIDSMSDVPTMVIEATPVPAVAAPQAGDAVQGFATEVPLNVALQQILPPDYVGTISPDIDANLPVSWTGGRPWLPVLTEMLGAAGLRADVLGRQVLVQRVGGVAPGLIAAAPVPSAPAMMPPSMAPQVPMDALIPATAVPDPGMVMPSAGGMMTAPGTADGAMPAPAADPLLRPDTWDAAAGGTLRSVLEEWAARVNVQLIWDAEYDYPVRAGMRVVGNFAEAVRHVLTGFAEAAPQPVGRLHSNPAAAQSVLIITTRGNDYEG